MQEKIESNDSEKSFFFKNLVSLIALCFAIASVVMIFAIVEYVGLICALIAIIMGVVVLIKKLSGKIFAVLAILAGLAGAIFGGIITVEAMRATFGWGVEEVEFSYDCSSEIGMKNCQEVEADSQEDASLIEETGEKLKACIEEKGIDYDIDYDDLAESEKAAYDECVKTSF
ncbi:hypothetical protein IKG45_00600 [Candidatus Saccharibacteria bacterium]|nr:hypothetical protein [Candidatus Saccharibacteria bacterium]